MKKGILIICSILLCVALGGLLVVSRKSEAQQIEENKAVRETIADTERVQLQGNAEPAVSSEVETSSVDNKETEQMSETDETSATEETAAESTENHQVKISIRGDSFIKEDKLATDGIGAALTALFEEKKQEAEVQDYTLYHAGSMTQLRLAGVDEETIDTYVKEHTENADHKKLTIYEKKVRAAEEMDLTRKDQDGIPVLFMGYWGGWYYTVDELIDQQKAILETYDNPEAYIIVGYYPNKDMKIDKQEYKDKMESAWGDHYLQLDDAITHSLSGADGSKDAADAIYQKMVALGYVDTKE